MGLGERGFAVQYSAEEVANLFVDLAEGQHAFQAKSEDIGARVAGLLLSEHGSPRAKLHEFLELCRQSGIKVVYQKPLSEVFVRLLIEQSIEQKRRLPKRWEI